MPTKGGKQIFQNIYNSNKPLWISSYPTNEPKTTFHTIYDNVLTFFIFGTTIFLWTPTFMGLEWHLCQGNTQNIESYDT